MPFSSISFDPPPRRQRPPPSQRRSRVVHVVSDNAEFAAVDSFAADDGGLSRDENPPTPHIDVIDLGDQIDADAVPIAPNTDDHDGLDISARHPQAPPPPPPQPPTRSPHPDVVAELPPFELPPPSLSAAAATFTPPPLLSPAPETASPTADGTPSRSLPPSSYSAVAPPAILQDGAWSPGASIVAHTPPAIIPSPQAKPPVTHSTPYDVNSPPPFSPCEQEQQQLQQQQEQPSPASPCLPIVQYSVEARLLPKANADSVMPLSLNTGDVTTPCVFSDVNHLSTEAPAHRHGPTQPSCSQPGHPSLAHAENHLTVLPAAKPASPPPSKESVPCTVASTTAAIPHLGQPSHPDANAVSEEPKSPCADVSPEVSSTTVAMLGNPVAPLSPVQIVVCPTSPCAEGPHSAEICDTLGMVRVPSGNSADADLAVPLYRETTASCPNDIQEQQQQQQQHQQSSPASPCSPIAQHSVEAPLSTAANADSTMPLSLNSGDGTTPCVPSDVNHLSTAVPAHRHGPSQPLSSSHAELYPTVLPAAKPASSPSSKQNGSGTDADLAIPLHRETTACYSNDMQTEYRDSEVPRLATTPEAMKDASRLDGAGPQLMADKSSGEQTTLASRADGGGEHEDVFGASSLPPAGNSVHALVTNVETQQITPPQMMGEDANGPESHNPFDLVAIPDTSALPSAFPAVDDEERPKELEDTAVPIYCISDDDEEGGDDSEVEVVLERRSSEPVSDHVRLAMERLHLENVALRIPNFTRLAPPSADDVCVVQAMRDILDKNIARRSTPSVFSRNRGCVLVIARSPARARRLCTFVEQNSAMKVTLHSSNVRGRGKHNEQSTSIPLQQSMTCNDVVVATNKAVLDHANKRMFSFRNVFLIVIDTAEDVWKRSHCTAMLMRDHYRALGEQSRPRVLAIARTDLHASRLSPIEFNLMAKFVSPISSGNVLWKSCHGKGSRLPEFELLDVEYINYKNDGNEMLYHFGRRTSVPRATERRGFSPIDSVVDEIGSLGVALYRCHLSAKKQMKPVKGRSPRWSKGMHIHVDHEHATLGLTQKMMSLLNEIYEAYKASTDLDSLVAIVYAGKPVVSCAMCLVIKSLPVFESLVVSVAIGKRSEDNRASSSAHDEFEGHDWQGADTDDDEVSNFTSGETNVLIVADSYVERQKKLRPLPSSPLVIRFDGSEADPELDGRGGRCRVIVFRDHTKRGNPVKSDNIAGQGENGKSAQVAREVAKEETNGHKDDGNATGHSVAGVVASDLAPLRKNGTAARRPAVRRQSEGKRDRRHEEQANSYSYHCRPANPLLGPNNDDGSPARAFLYRPLVFGASPSKLFSLSEVTRTGVENFVMALSSKLEEQDLIFSFKEYSNGSGNGSTVMGFVKLQYQGSVTISDERLEKAREYNTNLFSLIDNSFKADQFSWGNPASKNIPRDDPCHNSFLRRYLVLPAKVCEPKQNDLMEVSGPDDCNVQVRGVELDRKCLLEKYFGDLPNKEAPLPNTMQIDWESVESVLDLTSREKHDEQCQLEAKVSEDSFQDFEGKLLFSSMPHETVVMSGRLQYNVSPFTYVSRSRKFALNSDGTFKHQDELVDLIGISATEYTIQMQRKATGTQQLDVIDLDEEPPSLPLNGNASKSADLSESAYFPVRWCDKERTLVRSEASNCRLNKFNCQRNVLKRRNTWIGEVRYRVEQYANRFCRNQITMLTQPLLQASKSRRMMFAELMDILHGASVQDVCNDIVRCDTQSRVVVPELSRVYPISIGAVFLPSVLMHVEQHLSICELRGIFDKAVGVIGELSQIVRAVTASHINTTTNYERLEFLGDSLFKLSCTVRLCVKHTHDREGLMSAKRGVILSNQELFKRAEKLGLYQYARFQKEYVNDWKPPGTDTRATALRFQIKTLADIVEALCGAYFIVGTKRRKSTSKRARTSVDVRDRSDSAESDDSDVEWVQSSDDEEDRWAKPKPSPTGAASVAELKSRKRKRAANVIEGIPLRFSASSVERGYEAGFKFLEKCGALYGNEPSHRDVLLASIYAIMPKGSKRPKEVTLQVLPRDARVSVSNKVWEERFGGLEKLIGYKFKRRHLLMCALTHRSFVRQNGAPVREEETYERLEFLGDAVADFFVVCYLYERFPELGPGELTMLKGNVVSNESFARVSMSYGLHKYLQHKSASVATDIAMFEKSLTTDLTEGGKGAQCALKHTLGEMAAPKFLGDLFEAIVGAVFVDSGLKQGWRVCMRLLDDCLRINADPERGDIHPCDELLDMAGRVWKLGSMPVFTAEPKHGSHGSRKMARAVYLLGERIAMGVGSTERRAKLVAARNALKLLKDTDPNSDGAKLLKRLKEEALRRRARAREDSHRWMR